MKRTLILFGILTFVVAVCVALVLPVLLAGAFSARTIPSSVEMSLAKRLRALSVPRSVREASNPVTATPEVLREAMAHFADHCATCHANDGSGNSAIGKGLSPRPPDMRQTGTQSQTDAELYYAIHYGIRFTGMPAFGDEKAGLEDNDSWKLVHFIRHLPQLTEEDKQVMKKLNPRTPEEFAEEEQFRRFLAGDDVPEDSLQSHHHD